MSTYTVRFSETISDVVLNSTGNLANWDFILTANGFTTWTPDLTAGQVLQIPDTAVIDQNSLRALTTYPANNHSVPDIYDQIGGLTDIINSDWILRTGFWNDSEHWHDTKFWIDSL